MAITPRRVIASAQPGSPGLFLEAGRLRPAAPAGHATFIPDVSSAERDFQKILEASRPPRED
jgi:hypothetical protein